MTPSLTLPWVVAAVMVVLFFVAAGFRFRRRQSAPTNLVFDVQGAPVTVELQQLFGAYGQSRVVGVVQLRDGLQVTYENGVHLTFVPVHTGGQVGGVRE